MPARHVIDLALDLARMPALARTAVAPPIPPDVVELMRIAAANPQACRVAADHTGEPTPVLIEAARFYLQQVLLRPEADCYRVLGIERTASRAIARDHMRWLLQWLHPDRNASWDALYAERVVKAWREVSAADGVAPLPPAPRATSRRRRRRGSGGIRVPWIELPVKSPRQPMRRSAVAVALWAVSAAALVVLALWAVTFYLGLERTAAMVP